MKVSIITVAYNSERTIEDTLSSIASQTYSDIEHIVIDGNSSDNTCALVKKYKHVAHFLSEPDNGIYNAMNKGVKLATGDIIGILNSDDIYADDEVVADIVTTFENEKCSTLYGDLKYVKSDQLEKVVRTWKGGRYNKNSFLFGWMPPHPTFFVRKELYRKFGHFQEHLRSAADYELMLRFLYKHDVDAKYLPRTIVLMREGGISNSSFKNRLRANREDRDAWRLNQLKPYFFTTYLKPIRKINQFIIK